MLNIRRVLLKMDMDFELWILIPSLFHPGMVEYIKTAFKNAVFNFELVIL